MAQIEFTPHLRRFFPGLGEGEMQINAGTVGELIDELDRRRPGIKDYILDERDELRSHVNIFIGEQVIRDPVGLSDRLEPDSRVFIMQALSGG